MVCKHTGFSLFCCFVYTLLIGCCIGLECKSEVKEAQALVFDARGEKRCMGSWGEADALQANAMRICLWVWHKSQGGPQFRFMCSSSNGMLRYRLGDQMTSYEMIRKTKSIDRKSGIKRWCFLFGVLC